MQNNAPTVPVKVYKRSHSGGRELTDKVANDNKPMISDSLKEKETLPKQSDSSREESSDRSSVLYRRSTSRGRCDFDADTKSRSASICKNSDDYAKSLCSSYSSDISDKYKYYSPYIGKKGDKSEVDCPVLSCKVYENTSRDPCLSPTKEAYGRPPSGCLSPPPESSARRRSTQRRISRFLRPDFYEQSREESAFLREKKQRERETQSVLKEIREKSRERSKDSYNQGMINIECVRKERLSQAPESTTNARHVRNKSLERFYDTTDPEKEIPQIRRRSLSRPREPSQEKEDQIEKVNIAEKILQELQMLSAAKNKQEQTGNSKKIEKSGGSSKALSVKSKERENSRETVLEPLKSSSSNVTKKVTKVKKSKKSEIKENTNSESLNNGNLEQFKGTDSDKSKRESRLIRPKSYPSKEPEKITPNELPPEKDETANKIDMSESSDFKIIRPKSFPNSKLIAPKEVKRNNQSSNAITSVVDKIMDRVEKPIQPKSSSKTDVPEVKATSSKSNVLTALETKVPAKKIVKIVKKTKSESSEPKLEKTEKIRSSSSIPQPKEKSPEKKAGKGLLYAIGQKFEKLRENATKSKDKKLAAAIADEDKLQKSKENGVAVEATEKADSNILKKKKSKSTTGEDTPGKEEKSKGDKKSRIDSMIRSLRERSITRAPVITESGLIKRAVSVEDMPGTFNKTGVNKVLGLFKKFEKDSSERRVMNTRSTSNIERQMKGGNIVQKDRPKSSGFLSSKILAPTAANNPKDSASSSNASESKTESNYISDVPPPAQNKCPECEHEQEQIQAIPVKSNVGVVEAKPSAADSIAKEKRKDLTLDFSKLDNSNSRHKSYFNDNLLHYSDMPYGNYNNNNFHIGLHEINRNNLLTPSNENIANYSSDSRSPYDDCASSSTFLSPSEEPELCFDNWSVCSEDNFISTPSPNVSRLSRASQFSSPTIQESQPESVIDRIKRKSFYCRFNEKKPKRQSSIVGPAARDYYRESAAKLRARPPDRLTSPDIEPIRTTHEYFKPLKLSSAGSDLKPPHYKSSLDYAKPRKSLNDIYPPSSTKRYSEADYSRTRNGSHETNSTSYYNTYTPNRRSSFTINGIAPSSNSNIESYVTLGRRLRPYDHRSFSTLDSTQCSNISPNSGALRRDQRTNTDIGNYSRTNLHLRTSSVPRSPTNI